MKGFQTSKYAGAPLLLTEVQRYRTRLIVGLVVVSCQATVEHINSFLTRLLLVAGGSGRATQNTGCGSPGIKVGIEIALETMLVDVVACRDGLGGISPPSLIEGSTMAERVAVIAPGEGSTRDNP